MSIKRVILTGKNDQDQEDNVPWSFDETGVMLVNTDRFGQATILDGNADGYTYQGISVPGTATSAAEWAIRRWNTSGNPVVTQYADGDSAMDNVWDNRTSLSYT